MCRHSELHRLVPSVLSAIEQVNRQLSEHRRHVHAEDACDDFVDCAGCGALEHRLATLTSYRDNGGSFIPVKGLRLDDQGEVCFQDVLGHRHYGQALQGHIDRTLARFGLAQGSVG